MGWWATYATQRTSPYRCCITHSRNVCLHLQFCILETITASTDTIAGLSGPHTLLLVKREIVGVDADAKTLLLSKMSYSKKDTE